MTLNDEYRYLGSQLCTSLTAPRVRGLYLPAAVPDETYRDEFGFVFLDDGSVGPFYVSLGDMLRQLWRRHPQPAAFVADAEQLLDGYGDVDLAARGLAVGVFNALSAAVMRNAGFDAPDRVGGDTTRDEDSSGRVGMVGYFCPLVDRLTEQGHSVLVLEHAPQRIPERDGVVVTRDPAALRDCSHVLCTASTLVNDSLESLLDTLGGQVPVDLIGPSGSGLPDPLFARGIRSVGGIRFASRENLLAQLAASQPWGSAGRKYQLESDTYPGAETLLARLANRGADADQP
ncbi:MAG: hypothetical protein KDJ24_14800 [Gammaproteobacteria bacterium]|nr:hypothetical protein [Gammaproteobacteria bacterium]